VRKIPTKSDTDIGRKLIEPLPQDSIRQGPQISQGDMIALIVTEFLLDFEDVYPSLLIRPLPMASVMTIPKRKLQAGM
jgi:hypothetical protein